MAREFKYKPWVPQVEENRSFPFSFKMSESEKTENESATIELITFEKKDSKQVPVKEQMYQKVKEFLYVNFDFKKYLNKYSKHYNKLDELNYTVKVNIFLVSGSTKTAQRKLMQTMFIDIHSFSSKYKFNLITNIEDLKKTFELENYKMSFDTEATCLDPETGHIVGFSFSMGNKEGYYVPIKHSDKSLNVDYLQALKIIYEAMTKASIVYMFNSRFDMRMMEYTAKMFDMSKVKVRDVQISMWFADPDFRKHSLKDGEKHFLGYYRPDLLDTLKGFKKTTYNTALVSPANLLFYAAQDAISTFELGERTDEFYFEFQRSGVIDQTLLYPLMKMENHGIRIDTLYLKEQLDYIIPRLNELNELIAESIGAVNLNSPKQKAELFKTFNLDTKVLTETGNMATGTKEVEAMIERLEARGEPYPDWLKLLGERAKLEKLQSTFFGSLLEQALLSNGRVRINYRNTQAATGRLSSGADFGE